MGVLWSQVGLRKWLRWDRSREHVDPDVELQLREFEIVVLEAIDEGDVEMLKYLHEQESFVFWGGIVSVTTNPPLLHRATAKGHKPVVEYLLSLGVDPDNPDSSGLTVLHVACKTLENTCLSPLLARSRDIDKRDVWGRTPLIKALVYRNVEAAQMLLERGANPNASDIYGMTPLTTAIAYDMMDVLGQLVRHGADVNLLTHHHHGRCLGPPLYLAINNQNLPMVQELLRLGASTEPRVGDYATTLSPVTAWSHIVLGSNPPAFTHSLQHNDVVSLAMSEVTRRGEADISESSPGVMILMELLAAHGYPLGSSPDILIRVLLNYRPHSFSMLLYKIQVCSSCCSEDILIRMALAQGHIKAVTTTATTTTAASVQQVLKQTPRMVSSLQDQARRAARTALMGSDHNVAWACSRLQCPPALKSLLLLRDIDRAFSGNQHLVKTV